MDTVFRVVGDVQTGSPVLCVVAVDLKVAAAVFCLVACVGTIDHINGGGARDFANQEGKVLYIWSTYMAERKRVWWMIVVGILCVLFGANYLPPYLTETAPSNYGFAKTAITFFGGLYLVFRGLYPKPD